MPCVMEFDVIASIHTDFPSKFGLPRQSGMSDALKGTIVFEPAYRRAEAFRGLEGFSHIWVLWEFSEAKRAEWSPTVRPPRLGGNARLGVFATRSPFRPNPIGLSCVRLEGIEQHPTLGTVLHVSGIDMMDRTPIYDIKPYLPYTDAHAEAAAGWTATADNRMLEVLFPDDLLLLLPEEKREGALDFLSHDPRPAYSASPDRVYKVEYAGFDLAFSVSSDGKLAVSSVERVGR